MIESYVYVGKDKEEIVGFASIYRGKYNVWNFQSTLKNLYNHDKDKEKLLTDEETEFAYLDQVSVIPDYKRKGVGRAKINKIFEDFSIPIVSFIVMKPLANIASAKWHESIGFKIDGTADSNYKGKLFEWRVYIH